MAGGAGPSSGPVDPANRAPSQGGILEGANPSQYDSKNPITLFIIQAGIIIIFCRLLHYPLSKIRQPTVIAEVIGGILLGPSVMGRIPGFTNAIFPPASLSNLNLVANVGLVLFLFLVGLEVDMRLLRSNWRVALSVGAAGMLLPFGLGCAVAYGLYHEFADEPGMVPISFGVYMLFIGVAMAITAFPVLCRILTELKLLNTTVGVIVLSAGVGNDVTGWILLALCVALVNAGSGLTALWVLLVSVAWILFLIYAVRPLFRLALIRTGSLQNGPTQAIMALTLLMVLTSAWFTNVIGIHAIFGGFLVGLICPHEGGFAIKVTEKLEDLVTVLFLPLYFALSGLSTNFGLLDTGITWAYVFAVLFVAFFGKIIGGTLAARFSKLVWRESFTIGVLMSCKGLVELIVLNIGLQARLLSTRTFTIFVIMALVTTFATTPLTTLLYPPWYQKKLEAWKRGEIDWDGTRLMHDDDDSGSEKDPVSIEKLPDAQIRRLLVYLRLDSLPGLFTFISLLGGNEARPTTPKIHKLKSGNGLGSSEAGAAMPGDGSALAIRKRPLEVHGVRMVELTDRDSSVMKVSEIDDDARDPVVNVFHTFASLNNVAASAGIAVVPEDSFAETLTGKASDLSTDFLLVPWTESGDVSDAFSPIYPPSTDLVDNRFVDGAYNHFVLKTLSKAACNTAIFVNRDFGGKIRNEKPALSRSISAMSLRSNREVQTAPVVDRSHHIFLPYFGGADDKVAVRFVLQLAQNVNITATILHVTSPARGTASQPGLESSRSSPSGPANVEHIDDEQEKAFIRSLSDSLPRPLEPRVLFESLVTDQPLEDVLDRAKKEVGQSPRNAGDLVIVGRRKPATKGATVQLMSLLSSLGRPSGIGAEARQSLGEVAETMLVGNVKASILVIQAAVKAQEA